MTTSLPVFRFHADVDETRALEAAAARVIQSRWYVLGSECAAFEREFALYCGVPYCIGVANGTDALEIALRVNGVKPGDTVVTVANAGFYVATALNAIGAVPRYVDIGEDLTVDPRRALAALEGARAIVVTHLYGRLAPVEAIVAAARRAGVRVIEDCAQAHGAARAGRRAGSFGDAACFSFYPTKNLGALGDGGAIVTADEAIATSARALRQYGWGAKYSVERTGGRNSRLDEIQAAFLRAKLPRLDAVNRLRVSIATRYCEALRGLPLTLPRWDGDEYVAHLFVVRGHDRDALRAHLASQGIATDIHYPIADHHQAVNASRPAPALPMTEQATREIVTLPCFPGMTDAEIDSVIYAIRRHYGARAT